MPFEFRYCFRRVPSDSEISVLDDLKRVDCRIEVHIAPENIAGLNVGADRAVQLRDLAIDLGLPIHADDDVVVGDPRVDVGLAVLDPLSFDTLPPFCKLGLLVGQQDPFKPEDSIVEPRDSGFRLSPRRSKDSSKVVDAVAVHDERQDVNVFVALLLAAVFARHGEARPR